VRRTNLSLYYLAGYLVPAGLLLLFVPEFATKLLRGIYAGWLIALMVWLLPFAESARVWVIGIITYIVGLGGFAHIIAGSVEAFFMTLLGKASVAELFMGFIIPALLGNAIGGVSLVAAINHAQVVAGSEGADV